MPRPAPMGLRQAKEAKAAEGNAAALQTTQLGKHGLGKKWRLHHKNNFVKKLTKRSNFWKLKKSKWFQDRVEFI